MTWCVYNGLLPQGFTNLHKSLEGWGGVGGRGGGGGGSTI